jgi:hypothetical protein
MLRTRTNYQDAPDAQRTAYKLGMSVLIETVRGWDSPDRRTWMLYSRAGQLLLTYWPDGKTWLTPGGRTGRGGWDQALHAAKNLNADPACEALASMGCWDTVRRAYYGGV